MKIIIAGGKTGGHLFPGIAIAQAFLRIDPRTEILFVGTGEAFEITTLERYGFSHTGITISGIKGKGIFDKIRSMAKIPGSLFQALSIINGFKPDLVMGVGGYSSGPVVLGARLWGALTAIQEQNAIPGITNRILSRFCHVVFTAFKTTQGLSNRAVTIHTGNPVRTQGPGEQTGPLRNSGRFNLLVTGGSQGAHSINQAVLGAVNLLTDPDALSIVHQTGKQDEKEVAERYREMGIKATAKAFFNDMPGLMASADLIISRAGAGSISEITAMGKPSLLIPYPYAADDHQRYNARNVADQGACWMILDKDLTPEGLQETIEFSINNPDKLRSMGGAAKDMSMPDADRTIAETCLAMAREQGI
ncbi:MAG: undecaprenyldiphospho-muramoylpentapeptide beta-N-acetylglucosaminyltransferase [Desulfobacterium sp.]|nr:undecaprenyldiphospho-muramoylpentapeptide beta-N-acetylglucosaminyltransferase [Desulfobacterium sp.]